MEFNKKVILIVGPSGTGKSFSLKRLVEEHGDKLAIIDTDGKNMLPFRGKNKVNKWINPSDPLEINPGVRLLEQDDSIEYIVIDSGSHWLSALEQKYVINSSDSRGAWGKIYQQELRDLFHFATHESKKTWIFIWHTMEGELRNGRIPIQAAVKGAMKNVSLESFFQIVIYTDVAECDECEEGIKYRFQVKKTKDTRDTSIKTPFDMFDSPYTETNDIMIVLDAIDKYEEE